MTRGDGDLTAADLTVCRVDHDLETTPRLTSTAGRRPAVPAACVNAAYGATAGAPGRLHATPRPAPPRSRSAGHLTT